LAVGLRRAVDEAVATSGSASGAARQTRAVKVISSGSLDGAMRHQVRGSVM
jgi:hypothetical protein